jgi:hypothetical protein
MIVSYAPNCGVTYEPHYDNHNSFIIQAQISDQMDQKKEFFVDICKHSLKGKVKQLASLQFQIDCFAKSLLATNSGRYSQYFLRQSYDHS